MGSLVSHIGYFDTRMGIHLSLYRHVPRLEVGNSCVWVEDDRLDIGGGGPGNIKGDKQVLVVQGRRGSGIVNPLRNNPRDRSGGNIRIVVSIEEAVEDAVTQPNHCVLEE